MFATQRGESGCTTDFSVFINRHFLVVIFARKYKLKICWLLSTLSCLLQYNKLNKNILCKINIKDRNYRLQSHSVGKAHWEGECMLTEDERPSVPAFLAEDVLVQGLEDLSASFSASS